LYKQYLDIFRTGAPDSLLTILMPLGNVLSLMTGAAFALGEVEIVNGNSSDAVRVAIVR
jgi:hypothetical protein